MTKYARGVQESMAGGNVNRKSDRMYEIKSPEGKDFALIVLGEKCKSQLMRDQKKRFKMTIADTTKSTPTFSQVRSSLKACENDRALVM